MITTERAGPVLAPLEAYEQVMRFAATRGEDTLLLALHAAVPQVLRPEVVHLLRLNFVPESLEDPAVEADVLFAPFCEHLGNGYFRFDSNARLHLLVHLDPAYEEHSTFRSQQVASFLLSYFDEQSRRVASINDPVYAAHLEVERWVALAFLNPEAAANQLAFAVRQACDAGSVAARLRIGGLTSALATPLVQYQALLAYAAGVDMLQRGDVEAAHEVLQPLGDRELEIAGVRLPSPRGVLEAGARAQRGPEERKDADSEARQTGRAAPRVFLCYTDARGDDLLAQYISTRLAAVGIAVWSHGSLLPGESVQTAVETAARNSDTAIFIVSDAWLQSDSCRRELHLLTQRDPSALLIPILRGPRQNRPVELEVRRGVEWLDDEHDPDARFWEIYCGLTGQAPGPAEEWSARGRALPGSNARWDPTPATSLHSLRPRDRIYVSYSHKDVKFTEELRAYVLGLEKDGLVEWWDDRSVDSEWSDAIALARVAIVLVTQDYLHSEHMMTKVFPKLEEAAHRRDLKLTWICVKSCTWTVTVTHLHNWQALHDPSMPLMSLRRARRQKVFVDIRKQLRQILRDAKEEMPDLPGDLLTS